MQALERSTGKGITVVGIDAQRRSAKIEPRERDALSQETSLLAYSVTQKISANLPGGCHLFLIGDGAHISHPCSKRVGIATSWAVVRGLSPLPAPSPIDHNSWLLDTTVACGGNLGPGSQIACGEVAASIMALRIAIFARSKPNWAYNFEHFNVLYGIDSKSCADEMDDLWEEGDLVAIRK